MEDTVIFKDSEGTRLSGALTEVTKKNLVIMIHGYGGTKQDEIFNRLIEELVPQGISTFRFDMFGHGESDGDFNHMTVRQLVDGLFSALDMLTQMGFENIGCVGFSLGGLVSLVGASQNDTLSYLSLLSPASDITSLKSINDGKDNIAYDIVKNLHIPVLIVHGTEDKLVSIEQSKKLDSLLSNSILEVVEGADHLYYDEELFERAIHLMVDFILKHKQ
jgi:uncharacterized protein